MKLGAHAMIWTSHWSDETLPLIDRVASLGLDFIEIPLMDIAEVHPQAIRARLDSAGIGIVTSTVLKERTDFTSPDPDVRAAGVDYLKRCIDATVAMGAHQFSGVIYAAHGKRPKVRPAPEEWSWSAQCLAEVADYAARSDVTVGLEPVNRYESPLLNTCEQAVRLAGMTGAANVKVHLDTYHMSLEETSWHDPIALAGDRLCHVHLCENTRGIPGTGLVGWEELFAALGAIGYQGYTGFESFIDVSPDMAAGTCIWRDLAPDGDTLVREGAEFLRGLASKHGL